MQVRSKRQKAELEILAGYYYLDHSTYLTQTSCLKQERRTLLRHQQYVLAYLKRGCK